MGCCSYCIDFNVSDCHASLVLFFQKAKKRDRAEAAVNVDVSDEPVAKAKKQKQVKSDSRQKNGMVKSAAAAAVSGRSGLGSGTVAEARAALKQSSRFKTVAHDPKASKTMKSLFSSSAKPRDKDQCAHWVTYNPYHYAG